MSTISRIKKEINLDFFLIENNLPIGSFFKFKNKNYLILEILTDQESKFTIRKKLNQLPEIIKDIKINGKLDLEILKWLILELKNNNPILYQFLNFKNNFNQKPILKGKEFIIKKNINFSEIILKEKKENLFFFSNSLTKIKKYENLNLANSHTKDLLLNDFNLNNKIIVLDTSDLNIKKIFFSYSNFFKFKIMILPIDEFSRIHSKKHYLVLEIRNYFGEKAKKGIGSFSFYLGFFKRIPEDKIYQFFRESKSYLGKEKIEQQKKFWFKIKQYEENKKNENFK